MMNLRLLTLAVALCALAGLTAGPVSAAIVFDNWTPPGTTSIRSAGDNPLASLIFSQNVSVSQIAVLNDLGYNGNIKFLVFDDATNARLFMSPAMFFQDDGMSWKTSGPLAFTFQAGKQYNVGAIADVPGDWAYDLYWDSMNGIQAASNANVSGFAAPELRGDGAADVAVRLYGGGQSPNVPEFGALPLALVGILPVLGYSVRRRLL